MTSDPFKPLELFAFPVFATMVGGHEKHNAALLDEILELERAHPGLRRSNRGGWHSADELMASRTEAMAWLLQGVMAYARRALAPYYGGWQTSDLRLGSYWANVMGPGGFNAPHHHHPQHWSGVYYVSVPQVGGTSDDTSGMIEFLNPSPIQSHWGAGSFAYGPRPGAMLLFPSSLVHLVHPHQAEDKRVSIAYNLNVLPKR